MPEIMDDVEALKTLQRIREQINTDKLERGIVERQLSELKPRRADMEQKSRDEFGTEAKDLRASAELLAASLVVEARALESDLKAEQDEPAG